MTASPTILLSLVVVLALVHGALSSTVSIYCKDGYLQSTRTGEYCFRAIRSMRRNWEGAKAKCEAKGAKLATHLSDPDDIKALLRGIRFRAHFWIGVKRPSTVGDPWQDLDGNVIDLAFRTGRGLRHHCATVKKGRTVWFDKACYKKHFFVCELDAMQSS